MSTVMSVLYCLMCLIFFFNDTATTEIYTLSLHDALPISSIASAVKLRPSSARKGVACASIISSGAVPWPPETETCSFDRSEEHTSELQSRQYLVCRLLLEKKKNKH